MDSMSSQTFTSLGDFLSLISVLLAILYALFIAELYRFTTDPLHHIPGSLIARCTSLWLWKLTWSGVECRTITALHSKYGPVVRVAPNEVDYVTDAQTRPNQPGSQPTCQHNSRHFPPRRRVRTDTLVDPLNAS